MTESKGLSGTVLKTAAIATMLLDHIGASLVQPFLTKAAVAAGVTSWTTSSLLSACPKQAIPYYLLRYIGRIAFPIFCFLLIEGFLHTRNLNKYCVRLAAFALISEIPFDLAFHRSWYYPNAQNVFFTLLIGLLTIRGFAWAETFFAEKKAAQAFFRLLFLLFGMGAALYLKTDYDYIGVLVIAALYEFRKNRIISVSLASVILCLMSPLEITAFAAVPLISRYNGKRSSAPEGVFFKYFFYLFYPVHLFLLYLAGFLILP